ncbi:hypothetical protein ACL9RL_11590 [Plantibacter sp. Mn2098]|uniref:hypothetical protein n=1 Tax=Plantibacter sp. Mn2098 TaxID=3395266 RepID=UPI003BC29CBC
MSELVWNLLAAAGVLLAVSVVLLVLLRNRTGASSRLGDRSAETRKRSTWLPLEPD